jgi:hypothetical protein
MGALRKIRRRKVDVMLTALVAPFAQLPSRVVGREAERLAHVLEPVESRALQRLDPLAGALGEGTFRAFGSAAVVQEAAHRVLEHGDHERAFGLGKRRPWGEELRSDERIRLEDSVGGHEPVLADRIRMRAALVASQRMGCDLRLEG